MGDEEVIVAPFLEVPVVLRIVLVAGGFQGPVEVLGVVLVEKTGRQITATTKPPPHLSSLFVSDFKVAEIEVHGRGVGIALYEWMEAIRRGATYRMVH